MSAMGQKRTSAHSMMTSTRCRNLSGTLRSMAFAVLRLMASSNFVGCSIGMSFGCLPCKILCTNLAPCRKVAGPSAPNDMRPPISTKAREVEAVGMRYLIAISVTGLIPKKPRTTTGSAPSFLMVEKAPSSCSGPWIITTGCLSVPVGAAARRTSSTIAFAKSGEAAVPNTPTRRTDGSKSRNSSTVFAFDAADIRDTPVMFPPGRAKLATMPPLDRVGPNADDRDILCCLLRRQRTGKIECNDYVDLELDQVDRERRKTIHVSFCRAKLESNVLSFHVAKFTQPFPKFLLERLCVCQSLVEGAYPNQFGLLGARRERQYSGRTSYKLDEIAPSHCTPMLGTDQS